MSTYRVSQYKPDDADDGKVIKCGWGPKPDRDPSDEEDAAKEYVQQHHCDMDYAMGEEELWVWRDEDLTTLKKVMVEITPSIKVYASIAKNQS
jgi:hypothetical protein